MNPVNIGRVDVVAAGGTVFVGDGTVTLAFKNLPLYVGINVRSSVFGIIVIIFSKISSHLDVSRNLIKSPLRYNKNNIIFCNQKRS